jgi:glycerol-3-phosphate acyltransferase PlsY
LLLDALKGAAAVLSAHWLTGSSMITASRDSAEPGWVVAGAAVAVIVGHCFPVWLGFRGGKGVATALGAFLALTPIAVGLTALVFLPVVLLTRYVSLASMMAALTLPVFIFLGSIWTHGDSDFIPGTVAALVAAGLIVFAHRGNIGRLVAGTESKFR